MTDYNVKEKIIEHYDKISPFYYSLWGKHLHHGFWVAGTETKDEAQTALIEHLAQKAGIQRSSSILDVGCGFGANSIYLAETYGAQTTGITISAVQADMAREAAKEARVNSKFLLMDAEQMTFKEQFDVVWSVESISHYQNKQKFFRKASQLVKPGGTLAIIDWFKKNVKQNDTYKKYIEPIEKGMLVKLHTMDEYISFIESSNLRVVYKEDISKQAAQTWDIALDIIKNKIFWQLALKNGKDFIHFLRSFQAMRSGFSSGQFVYGLIVAKKN